MLKHKYIIDRLSESQKIKILTNVGSLADEEYEKLGIPAFKLSSVEGFKQEIYPSPKSLANSWNSRVISDVATDMAVGMAANGINVISVPSPVPMLNICDTAITEDPFLSSRISGEYINTFRKIGMGAFLDGAYLDENGVSRLDKNPNSRFINEFVVRPIKKAVENSRCNGIIASTDIDVEKYETVNSDIIEKITVSEARSFENSYILCKNIAPDDTVDRISKGYICLDGSEAVLKAAIDRYKRLKNEISSGKVSVCELDAEIENGSAFPTEKINEALDRVLEFVFDSVKENKGRLSSNASTDTVVKNASYESTVLLKNQNNILPLKSGKVVALVGDILVNYDGSESDRSKLAENTAYYLREQGCSASGFYRGYAMNEDISYDLLSGLEAGISNVDTVILFMGTNPEKEEKMVKTNNLYLPANQLVALSKIRSMGKKIIAVVSSDMAFDVTFDKWIDALLVAPLNTKFGVEAVIDIITGKFAPIGRLAYTLYSNTELVNKKQGYYLDLPNAKVGTFIGYRYYDTVDFDVAYPFGFGLGYTKFKYSKLSVKGNEVAFTVKNKGKSAGAEVVQVYVGLSGSNRLRPKKELVGFEKVILQAGESVKIRIPLTNLEIFDTLSEQWVYEQGEYTVYVGSSVSDIRLESRVSLGNAVLDKNDERASDYLQSETNIISDRYTLEADYKLMKKGVRNIIFGAGSLCLAVAMFLFSLISGNVSIFFIIIAAILALAGVVFFILEGSDRSKLNKLEREQINAANAEAFSDAQQIEKFSTEQVFADEFDKVGAEAKKTQSSVQAKADNYLEFVNQNLTFKMATEQFIAFAAAKGCKFNDDSVRELFAAMSASRLVVTKGMTKEAFSTFINLLSEYFDTEAGVDTVDHSYVNDNSALFKKVGNVKQKTALATVLEASASAKQKVHIAALTDVTFAEISNYFVPFSRYIRNPHSSIVIDTVGEGGENVSFKPAENLWFFINLRVGESLRNIPSYIAELASIIKLDYTSVPAKSITASHMQFNYYQFGFMLEKIKSNNGMAEDTWKKIDSLEGFIRNSASFVLSNRICIGVERFYAVFNACGGEQNEAIDRALSARIIPSAVIALNGADKLENKNLSEKLGMIFGEDNVEISCASIKASGTSVL